jgi:hypothetical protein
MAAKKGSRTWFPRVDGGVHQRIWFAKAGRPTEGDAGIAPPAHKHIENATYSMNLSLFDPTDISKEEAVELGKEGSIFRNMGAQFGAQIWRLANEAEVGDFIFLESENHHLHAVGIISGEYIPFEHREYSMEDFKNQGVHRIPVKWIPIKDGKDYIQLGRLDNATFRDVAEKEELASLLIFGTQRMVAEVIGIDFEEIQNRLSGLGGIVDENAAPIVELTAGDLPDDFNAEPFHGTESDNDEAADDKETEEEVVVTIDEPAKPVAPVVEAPKPVFAHVARNGAYIHQKITEEALHDLIKSSQVLPTDHVFHPISINWITIAEYRNQRGLG